MYWPFGRKYCFLAFHPYMACFGRFSHKVTDSVAFGNFKIEIGFHATAMCMGRHRIPNTPGLQFGHTHLQLTGFNNLTHQHFIDVSMIGTFERTHFGNDSIGFRYFFIGTVAMGRSRIEIKFSRFSGIYAFKRNRTITTAQIKGFLKIQIKGLSVDFDTTGSSDIENTDFTTA